MIYFFGYAKTEREPDNSTGFFEYDTVDEQFERKHKFFKTQNEGMIDWVSQLSDEDLARYNWKSSDSAKDIKFVTLNDSSLCTRAINNYTQKKMYGEAWTECD